MAQSKDDFPAGSLPALGSGQAWDEPEDEAAPEGEHAFDQAEGGRYERRQLLGQGGMGRVVAVWDRRLRREVALKEVADDGEGSSTAGGRLAQEAWITAQLDHPGIVPVLDAGRGPEGKLFYTMPIVRGRTLAAALEEAADLEARLALLPRVLAAAQAVAHAHQHGVVHRDLKPANILIGELGETQVVDWGLARSERKPESGWREVLPTQDAAQTAAGAVMGTPHYMSPEQANGLPTDQRTDVWSLGVTLYEVVAGKRPFAGNTSREVLAQVRRGRFPPLQGTSPELAAVIERALRHDADDRYPDARAFAQDLASFLSGRRVEAYSYRTTDLVRRVGRAWRVQLVAALAAMVAVVLVAWAAYERTTTERDRAQAAEAEARVALERADGFLAEALTSQALAAQAESNRAHAELLAAHALALGNDPRAWGVLAGASGRARPQRLATIELPPLCQRSSLADDGRHLLCIGTDEVGLFELASEQILWRRPATLDAGVILDDHEAVATTVQRQLVRIGMADGSLSASKALLPAGRWLSPGVPGFGVMLRGGDAVNLVDLEGVRLRNIPWCGGQRIDAATLVREDLALVMCQDGGLWRGDPLGDATRLQTIADDELAGATHLAVSPDGHRLAVSTRRDVVFVIDLETGEQLQAAELGVGALTQVRWSPDGRQLLVLSMQGPAMLWSPETGAPLDHLPASGATRGVWLGDNRLLLTTSSTVTEWEVPPAGSPTHVPGVDGITAVDVSPDGLLLAAARAEGDVQVIELATGRTVARPGHAGVVCKDAAFTPDGRSLVAAYAMKDHLLVTDTSTWTTRSLELSNHTRRFRRVVPMVGGLVVGLPYSAVGPAGAWLEDGRQEGAVAWPGRNVWEGEVGTGGDWAVALGDADEVLRIGATPSLEVLWQSDGAVAADITADGKTFALASRHQVGLYREDGEALRTMDLGTRRAVEVALSPDDTLLAVGMMGGSTSLFDVRTGELPAELHGHERQVAALDFTPDGKTLWSGSWDGDLRRWSLDVLVQDPAVVLAEAEAAWGLGLEDLLDL